MFLKNKIKSIKRASGKKTRPLSALINLEAQGGGHTHCRESWASKKRERERGGEGRIT